VSVPLWPYVLPTWHISVVRLTSRSEQNCRLSLSLCHCKLCGAACSWKSWQFPTYKISPNFKEGQAPFFLTSRHFSPTWVRSFHFMVSHVISLKFTFTLLSPLYLGLTNVLFTSVYLTKSVYACRIYTCNMPHQSQQPSFIQPKKRLTNNINYKTPPGSSSPFCFYANDGWWVRQNTTVIWSWFIGLTMTTCFDRAWPSSGHNLFYN
jgi:hypothetical protein